MNSFNWSTVISAITLLAAIFSPTVTAWVNNQHQRKVYNSRFYAEHRAEVIEKYISSVGRFIRSQRYEDMSDFGSCAHELYLYLPKALWSLVDGINYALSAQDFQHAEACLTQLCKKLAEDAPRSEI